MLAVSANAQVLTFEGIGDDAFIGNYYDGGAGPNFGISFFGDARGLVTGFAKGACDGSGSGNFEGQPSGCTIMFFPDASTAGMNRAAGFTTGFSLFYTAISQAGSLDVFDGLNGTGNILASLLLPVVPSGGSGCTTGASFCPFASVGVAFAGTALSVRFGGAANQIGFDDITFGSVTPGNVVPEPSTYALMATGLVGLFGAARRRRAQR